MIKDYKIGDKIHEALVIRVQKIGISSNGKPFGRGLMEDASGQVGFICFDAEVVDRLRLIEQPVPFMVAGVVDVNKFAEGMKLQIMVQRLSDLLPGDDISNLMPKGDFDKEHYLALLQRFIGMVKLPVLHTLLTNIFSGTVMDHFAKNPAGMRFHHAYLGGLLQHSVDVTKLAVAMAEQIGTVDMDLVIAGALLHDFGKLREISAELAFPYTTEGRLLGHVAIIALVVQSQADQLKMPSSTLEQLLHILLSHHGDVDKGSPIPCKTKEAFIVHYADELDSVMNQFTHTDNESWSYNKMMNRYLLNKKL